MIQSTIARHAARLGAGAILAGFCAAGLAAPGILNYQSKLTDAGGVPITSQVSVTFTFWDAVSGGNQVGNGFSDTDLVTPDSRGVCSTDIGDDPGNLVPSSVFAKGAVWLNVNVGGTDVAPRTRVGADGIALNAFPLYGESYVMAEPGPDPVANGQNLIGAYNRAKLLSPHDEMLTGTNRAVLLVPPGNYNLQNGTLNLNKEYVDIAGVSPVRGDQYIFGTSNGSGTGVVRKDGNDIHIENLTVVCTYSSTTLTHTSGDPSAYFPGLTSNDTVVRNCEFAAKVTTAAYSMRFNFKHTGQFIDCLAGDHSFGSGPTGEAAATYTNCTGGDFSFGGNAADATGMFINCTGGNFAFGGNAGNASGTFIGCTVASSGFGSGGTASGLFRDCRSIGGGSFGASAGTASGTFINCQSGTHSFGGEGTASGTFINCVSGDTSFGGDQDSGGGIGATGTFNNCTAGYLSFGGNLGIHSHTLNTSGTFTLCTGGQQSFGAYGNATGAKFFYCNGDASSFGGTGAPAYRYCLLNGDPYP